ncbi:magnesium transporter [Ferruginibacter sp. HRS2-29]|uniref:magnesium transporter n=1 Tax=Ferruginibacter sp. HRS2-29 TaxID=2487334 RepID=UPI0020CE8BFC|nr:magnesium transporter [Ferruginibacter sp. HRS2-29]MCP9750817.1 magnesium transporter [Ferruginibacter sp. HRS2-29]
MSLELDEIPLQQQFEEVIASEDKLAIQDFLNDQNISDVANLVYDNPDYETQIIAHLSIHRAASVFKILDLSEQKRIIHNLPPFKSAELLNELPVDDRVDFFEELPTGTVRELIKTLDPEERKSTLELLGYPENSVGRLMTPGYVYVYEYNTVKEVLESIRRYGTNTETIDVIYVINKKGELLDDIRIRDFILASPEVKVNELMDDRFIALNATDDQEIASEVFKMNNRVALPVVDTQNILLGIVTIDDILWVAQEEFTEDIQKIGGTEALDEPYLDISILKLVKKRASWLVILFLGEMLTATAMQYFEHEIEAATVLALFIPLIMSSGGNSGSQASTLIIQAMALGEVTLSDWWRVMKRELMSGALLGIILGLIGLLRIVLWQQLHIYDYGTHWQLVGTTICFSLMGIVLWGSLMGSMLPLILKRMKLDPAASSAPFVATLVDVTGIIIYFSVAYFFLKGTLL